MAETIVLYKATIPMLNMSDPSDSQTITVVNMPFTGSSSYPILKSLSGIGARMQEFTPDDTKASIILDDSINSIGHQRRFSDLLQRYTISQQKAVISIAIIDDLGTTPTWSDIWSGTVNKVSITKQGEPKISIELIRVVMPNKIITTEITTDIFPNAPESSIGRVLPLVFGTQQVEAHPVDAVEIASATGTVWPVRSYAQYAYATTIVNSYPSSELVEAVNDGVQKYYVQGLDNKWRQVKSASVNSSSGTGGIITEVFKSPDIDLGTATTLSSGLGWTAKEHAFYFEPQVAGVALTSIDAYFFQWTTDDFDVTIKLYSSTRKKKPNQIITTTNLEKADFANLGNRTDAVDSTSRTMLRGTFIFSDPIPISKNERIFISVSFNADSGITPIKPIRVTSTTANLTRYDLWDDATTGRQNWGKTGSVTPFYWKLHGLEFYDSIYGDRDTTDSGMAMEYYRNQTDGLGYSSLYVDSGVYSYDYDWTQLKIVVEIKGLHYWGDFINFEYLKPTDICALLLMKWLKNEAIWTLWGYNGALSNTDDEFDSGTANYYRIINGKTSGRTTVKQLLIEIMRNSASRLVPSGTGSPSLDLWAWGRSMSLALSQPITDEDANILSYEIKGSESIINRTKIFWYPKKITDKNIYQVDPDKRDFVKSKDSESTYYRTDSVIKSQQLYGLRELGENVFNYLPLTASSGADALSQFFLAKYSQPQIQIQFEVPYIKYRTLKLMDVIEILHADLPAFWGTSLSQKSPAVNDIEETDILRGYYLKRAQRLRIQIEGLEINTSEKAVPKLIITANVINRSADDPT